MFSFSICIAELSTYFMTVCIFSFGISPVDFASSVITFIVAIEDCKSFPVDTISVCACITLTAFRSVSVVLIATGAVLQETTNGIKSKYLFSIVFPVPADTVSANDRIAIQASRLTQVFLFCMNQVCKNSQHENSQ